MLTPFPEQTPVLKAGGLIGEIWARWLTNLRNAVNLSVQRVAAVVLANQSTSISTTSAFQSSSTSLYRLSYSLRITQAATISSSATVTFGWTDGGVMQSQSGAALTGNTTTTQQSNSLLIGADAGTAITYAIAYMSSGATSMQYGFRMSVEQLP